MIIQTGGVHLGMERAMPQAAIMERSPHSPPYKRHRPEQTLLYHITEWHYPVFRDVMVAQGKDLPLHVQQEFADYLKCGRLEHGISMCAVRIRAGGLLYMIIEAMYGGALRRLQSCIANRYEENIMRK
jgi:hypothetical protein